MAVLSTRFVGRRDEISFIRNSLEADGPRVVYVHGIGGIGKSALLRQIVRERSDRVVEFAATALPHAAEDLIARASKGLLVVDELEQMPGSAEMLRERVVPRLPADTRVLLASREAPGLRWRTDLGDSFVALELGGLDDASSRALLHRAGAPGARASQLLELCHGHPLMLLLAGHLADADALLDEGLEAAPTLVSGLVETFGALPREQRLTDALTVCSIARRVTEPLLEAVLGLDPDDCRFVFESLREQDWMSVDRAGLFPHELVRDAMRADAKWRNRPRYDELFRAVATFGVARVRDTGAEGLPDVVHLLADNPVYGRVSAHRHGVAPGPMVQTEDYQLVDEMLRPHQGDAFMDLLDECTERGAITPCLLFGPDGEASEVFCLLDAEYLQSEPTENPAVLVAREMLEEFGLREDSAVLFCHGFGGREHGQCSALSNSRVMTAALGLGVDRPGLAALGSILHPPGVWRPVIEHSESFGAYREVTIGDRDFIVHFQDMRAVDPAGWLEAQLYPPPVKVSPDVEMLDHDEFRRAVREALKAVAGKGQTSLDGCRLLSTPLVFRAAATPTVAGRVCALRDLIDMAIAGIDDERAEAAVRMTYVDPAPKQYAAAVELGVSFSTFRRALTRGVHTVTETLWEQEVVAAS